MKGRFAPLLAGILLSTLIGATPTVITDNSIILGAPMKIVVLRGAYVDALNLAYADWHKLKHFPPLLNQNVTMSPEPGTHIIYIRFVPSYVPPARLGGGDVLYVIDLAKRKIVRRVFGQ